MRPGRKEPRSFPLIVSGCAARMAALLALGACDLETIVVPEEAMDAMPEAVDGNEATEPSRGAVEPGAETAEVASASCRASAAFPAVADRPLVTVDGVRWERCWDEIAALDTLDIESFKIVRGSDAVEIYGEAARNGAILIFTKQSDGDGKGGGSPGEPPN